MRSFGVHHYQVNYAIEQSSTPLVDSYVVVIPSNILGPQLEKS